MEETSQAQGSQVGQAMNPHSDIGFPQPKEPTRGKSKAIKWGIALVGIIIIVAGGGWFIMQDAGNGSSTPTPTPGSGGLSTFPTPEPSATPEATSSSTPAAVSKSDVKIEVLNGTGTPGDASFLQKELEKIGFSEIEAGNADEQGETTTTVTFSRDLAAPIVDEITEKLKALYSDVTSRKGSLPEEFDVRIVTGTKKSSGVATPKASSSASPSPSTSASPSPTPTATQ